MKTTITHPLNICCVFLWIGFVCAISFMEAWLKFQAPGITLGLGLGIGRLVFSALNKIEWVFMISILVTSIYSKTLKINWTSSFYYMIALILLIQTLYLLPALDLRAEKIINQQTVEKSNLHFYYVTMEFIKVVMLFLFGINQFTQTNQNHEIH